MVSFIKTLSKKLCLNIDYNELILCPVTFLTKYYVSCLLYAKENKNIFLNILAKRNLINYSYELIFKKHIEYKIL